MSYYYTLRTGETVRMDTPAEVFELAHCGDAIYRAQKRREGRADAIARKHPARAPALVQLATEPLGDVTDVVHKWAVFIDRLHGLPRHPQRKLLGVLKAAHPRWLALDELFAALGVDSEQAANGTINGIRRNAIKAGLPADGVIGRAHDRGRRTVIAGPLVLRFDVPAA